MKDDIGEKTKKGMRWGWSMLGRCVWIGWPEDFSALTIPSQGNSQEEQGIRELDRLTDLHSAYFQFSFSILLDRKRLTKHSMFHVPFCMCYIKRNIEKQRYSTK